MTKKLPCLARNVFVFSGYGCIQKGLTGQIYKQKGLALEVSGR